MPELSYRITAVSYTHLDVYKRQDQERPGMLSVHKEPPERFEIFLLILSQDGAAINSRDILIRQFVQKNMTNFVKFMHTF